jgi:hypothetical protein
MRRVTCGERRERFFQSKLPSRPRPGTLLHGFMRAAPVNRQGLSGRLHGLRF